MVLFTFRYSGIFISDLLFPAKIFFFQALTSGGRSEKRYFKRMHAVLTSTTDDRLSGPGTASHMFPVQVVFTHRLTEESTLQGMAI